MQITTTSGSYLPHVEVTNKLDAGFGSSVEWLRSKVAVPDSLLRITVVVDGIPLQGTLNPPMLLGHNIASVISLAGVGDPLTNHSIVIIVSTSYCSPASSPLESAFMLSMSESYTYRNVY